ncbi:MAG TPA: metalloregulator ArsR/SmtB family transcription factor [Planctomycetota bacterium]|nr:metalloregulator ArsR/SmtB family transcription factor [Planctomycetota bacterium]HUV38831.1 metalloregulator ArsR/SmtB family transcription factor [Planctomycetota bacterium]
MKEDIVECCSEVFKAMGDPTRLQVLWTLFAGEKCVTDLAKALGMDAPRVSFHLTRLKHAGLVTDERRGQRVEYRLNPSRCRTVRGCTEIRIDGCMVRFGPDGTRG